MTAHCRFRLSFLTLFLIFLLACGRELPESILTPTPTPTAVPPPSATPTTSPPTSTPRPTAMPTTTKTPTPTRTPYARLSDVSGRDLFREIERLGASNFNRYYRGQTIEITQY